MDDLGYTGTLRQVTYDNTYISEPEGYGPGTKFERHKVHDVLQDMLRARLEGQQYDPVKSSQISKQLADDLREKVRIRARDWAACRSQGLAPCRHGRHDQSTSVLEIKQNRVLFAWHALWCCDR